MSPKKIVEEFDVVDVTAALSSLLAKATKDYLEEGNKHSLYVRSGDGYHTRTFGQNIPGSQDTPDSEDGRARIMCFNCTTYRMWGDYPMLGHFDIDIADSAIVIKDGQAAGIAYLNFLLEQDELLKFEQEMVDQRQAITA
jgi:hypothetical protein